MTLAANDYVELAWVGEDDSMEVLAEPAVTGPPAIPAIPSVILTVTQVM